jgi:hypothetical protein
MRHIVKQFIFKYFGTNNMPFTWVRTRFSPFFIIKSSLPIIPELCGFPSLSLCKFIKKFTTYKRESIVGLEGTFILTN